MGERKGRIRHVSGDYARLRIETSVRRSKDLSDIKNETYTPDSFFSFGGRQFSELTTEILFSPISSSYSEHNYGWQRLSIFSPHTFNTEHLPELVLGPIWDRATGNVNKGLYSKNERRNTERSKHETLLHALSWPVKAIFYRFGDYRVLRRLEKVRDERGKYEDIAVLFIHGTGDPLQVGVIDGADPQVRGSKAKSTILGTGQALINEFLEEAEREGRHFDRVILSACNPEDAPLFISKSGIILNYPTDIVGLKDDGYYPTGVVETTQGNPPKYLNAKGELVDEKPKEK